MARIVISLTTIPDRMKLLQKCLDSLLRQSVKVDRIYLQVPHTTLSGQKYDKKQLENIVGNISLDGVPETITINFVDQDEGPITKLTPVLDLEPDPKTYIILVDDDIIYHPDLVKTLTDPKYDSFDAIGLAGRTKEFKFASGRSLMDYSEISVTRPTQVWLLETFAGVRMKRALFPERSSDFLQWVHSVDQVESKCIYTDDIVLGLWYSMNISENQPRTRPMVIYAPHIKHIFNHQDTPRLGEQNLGQKGRNYICFMAVTRPISDQYFHYRYYRRTGLLLGISLVFFLLYVVTK